jgi:hypothetical protein
MEAGPVLTRGEGRSDGKLPCPLPLGGGGGFDREAPDIESRLPELMIVDACGCAA